MEKQILESLKKIFNSHFLIHVNQLKDRHTLTKDLGMNEWEKMEMLLYVENEFHITIDDNEIPQLNTVGDLRQCVINHMN